jgi:hypothetical protein
MKRPTSVEEVPAGMVDSNMIDWTQRRILADKFGVFETGLTIRGDFQHVPRK